MALVKVEALTGMSITLGGFFPLMPGVQWVELELWRQIESVWGAFLRDAVGRGWLSITVPDDEVKPLVMDDLGEYSAKAAIDIVRRCTDVDILGAWLKNERRKTVVKAIKGQLG